MIEKVVASYDCQSLTFLSELQSIKEMKKYLIKVDLPTNVDILPYKPQIRERPETIRFVYRNFLKYTELTEDRRIRLHADKSEYENWLSLQKTEFGATVRSEEERQKVKSSILKTAIFKMYFFQ